MPRHKLNSQKGFNWQICLTLCYIYSTTFLVKSSPPGDPIQCAAAGNKRCTISNSYGAFPDRSTCRAAEALYPSTEEELVSIVAAATSQKRKMKIATSTSHSIPKLSCPDGEDGILISTRNLNRTVEIDRSALTITVEPGMILRDLINGTAAAGLALPHVPYWWGLTVGGILGTGAHGSSLWGQGSCVHDYVIRLRIVTPAGADEGYAKVRTLENGEPALDAAKLSLGVLGVISQVTLQLQPMFKRSITFVEKNDSDIANQVSTFGRKHEFGDIWWYPSQNKVLYRIDDRVSSETPGDGLFDFLGFRSLPSYYLATGRTQEENLESAADGSGECAAYGGLTNNGQGQESITSHVEGKCAIVLSRSPVPYAYGLTNNGLEFTGYPVVGYNNHLQSSGSCLDSSEDSLQTACAWDPRINGMFFYEIGISISLSKIHNFILDVQKLVALHQPEAFCGIDLYNGILMRYIAGSTAYLGKDEDSVEVDLTYYRSRDPRAPRLRQEIAEEIEQMALFKYGGQPHWGKGKNMAFVGAFRKYKGLEEFLKVKRSYDPLGLFSNEWTDQILGLEDGIVIVKEGCGLEGLCVCSEDVHCAPEKGFFCRPGKVYEDARICVRLPYENVHDW